LKTVAYEGGPGISADPSTPAGQYALAASRDPRIEALVRDNDLNWYAAGGDVANYFDGPWSIWGPLYQWTVAEQYQAGHPEQSAKYRGLQDLAAAAPPALSVGAPVSNTAATYLNAVQDSEGQAGWISTGFDGFWLLRSTAGGLYHLTLTTAQAPGLESGQVQAYLNGQAVGGVVSVAPVEGTADFGNITLNAGL